MKKSRFTDSQIMAILKQHESGVPVAKLAREHNVIAALIYQWRSKFGGIGVCQRSCRILSHQLFNS